MPPSSVTTFSVADIVAHEQREFQRIEDLKRIHNEERKQREEAYKKDLEDAEVDERKKSMDELRSFEEIELPKILEAGEKDIVQSLQNVDTAKKVQPNIVASLVSSMTTGGIVV